MSMIYRQIQMRSALRVNRSTMGAIHVLEKLNKAGSSSVEDISVLREIANPVVIKPAVLFPEYQAVIKRDLGLEVSGIPTRILDYQDMYLRLKSTLPLNWDQVKADWEPESRLPETQMALDKALLTAVLKKDNGLANVLIDLGAQIRKMNNQPCGPKDWEWLDREFEDIPEPPEYYGRKTVTEPTVSEVPHWLTKVFQSQIMKTLVATVISTITPMLTLLVAKAIETLGLRLLGVHFQGVNMSFANLSNVRMENAQLPYANLAGADMSNGIFTGSNFHGANMKDVNFTGADLTGVDFSHANMRNARLTKANLTGANLGFADLEGANIEDAILDGTTVLPKAMLC